MSALPLPNGHYRTARGSEVWFSGESGGRVEILFDWFEEGACPGSDVSADPYNGTIQWSCSCSDDCGGWAELRPVRKTDDEDRP